MKILRSVVIMILVLGLASVVYAEQVKRTAKVISLEGDVSVKPIGKDWVAAQVDMALGEGDVIVTKKGASALLNVDGDGETATVTVNEGSQLLMTELARDKDTGAQQTMLELAAGKILIKAQKLHSEAERFEVQTPTTVVGVRGTVFEVEVGTLEE